MVNEYSGWHGLDNNPHVGFEPYSVNELKNIKVPSLIMYGGINLVGFLRLGEIQHGKIPNSKLSKITDAAHALNIENSDQYNN